MKDSKSLIARAREISANRAIPIEEALKDALLERFNLDQLADEVVNGMKNQLRRARESLFHVSNQLELFQSPEWIVVETPEGDLYKHRDDATTGEVLAFYEMAIRYHTGQAKLTTRKFDALDKAIAAGEFDLNALHAPQLKQLREAQADEN